MTPLTTRHTHIIALAIVFLGTSVEARAQGFTTLDPVMRGAWTYGMDSSRAGSLIQVLSDSIGPRLTGTSGLASAQHWIATRYQQLGIPTRLEQYGTWRGWQRGPATIELLEPRYRSLDARLLAWSPGTRGPVRGRVVTLPLVRDSAEFQAWLPKSRGTFVLVSTPEQTCRPDTSLKQWSEADAFGTYVRERRKYMDSWTTRIAATGLTQKQLGVALENAGAAGVVTSLWSEGWGVEKIHDAVTERIPSLSVSCEDYGLLARLAEHAQGPVLKVNAASDFPGAVATSNLIGEMRGSEKPEEYVVLSAHLDSWDGASGATDNGTGTVMMLEAMRILKAVYPHPKRTILVGHWSGEELRGMGSSAFAEDHPEITRGIQALFNQDNGTGRITRISMSGFLHAGASFSSWLSAMPTEMSRWVSLVQPGLPSGGSDHYFFLCHGVPAFSLSGESWDYGTYTWHTNLDTFDKVSVDDLRFNATLVAMLAYMASEDPASVSRERRVLPSDSAGRPREWPQCGSTRRSWSPSPR